MSERIQLEAIPNVPYIDQGDDVGEVILASSRAADMSLQEKDIICIASKAVSMSEGRVKLLSDVEVSDVAHQIHEEIPRKDPRAIQVIIDETGAPDGSRVELGKNYIAGWLPNGNRLTSSGVDKMGPEQVILLPENPDESAKRIGRTLLDTLGVNTAVIITDSDGRVEKAGSTQVAIGVYGLPALRKSESVDESGVTKYAEETLCDLVAASAALLMGQRGTNRPVVVVRGLEYEFDESSEIRQALSRPE